MRTERTLVILLLTAVLVVSGCSPKAISVNKTTNQTANTSTISREQAITIARYWLEGSYGAKTENSPVNATMSLFGNVTAWNITFAGVSGVGITGGQIPVEGAPPPPPFTVVYSGKAVIDIKTGTILAGGIAPQVIYLDK